jgi:hypothetical protein
MAITAKSMLNKGQMRMRGQFGMPAWFPIAFV